MNPELIKEARSISRRQRPSRRWHKLVMDKQQVVDGINVEFWSNDIYSVTVRRFDNGWPLGGGPYLQIGIHSSDGSARHDWRDFQNIKNDVHHAEWEAIELYPAESRLLDPSNYYMLWCAPDIKVGKFVGRQIADETDCIAPQRPFPK